MAKFKVKAKLKQGKYGYFGKGDLGRLVYDGDVFDVSDEEFSSEWMEKLVAKEARPAIEYIPESLVSESAPVKTVADLPNSGSETL